MHVLRKTTPLTVALALLLALLFGVLAMFGGKPASAQTEPGPPSGSGIQPIFVPGNVNCPAGFEELRVNAPADGTFSDGTLTVTIGVRDTADGPVFDWTSNIGVDQVFVKGGPDTNQYVYDPEAKGDTGLHAPVNPSNNKYYGLSHISFCYDVTPSIKVDKGGDELSKVGDKVTYTFKVTNDGDIPLKLDSVSDTLLGDLTAKASAANCATLAPGASCTFTADYTVKATDPDPLKNTVTVKYSGTLPGGSTKQVSATDTHSVNLFQPDYKITKSGAEKSKIGDKVTYTFKIENLSSQDSPELVLVSISDDKLGDLAAKATAAGCDVLTYQETCTFTVEHTIPAGAADPYVNKVTAVYSPKGFPNKLTRTATHSVNLFQPDYKITKACDDLSKIGDEVTCKFTITNTSSTDSPALMLVSISDDKLGDLAAKATAAGCDVLTYNEICTFTVKHKIPEGATDPYVNTVTAKYSPKGFPNVLTKTASHSVNLFQPSVLVEKTGPPTASVGQKITYNFTIRNTSSSDTPALKLDNVSDTVLGDLADEAPAACDTLAAGASCTFSADYTVKSTDPNPLVNVVTVKYHPDGFTNKVTDTDDHKVEIVANEGCTPGFWKNHPELWDGQGTDDVTTTIQTTDLFNATFGVTSAQSGLADSVTLLDAVNLSGGDKLALARHAAAALASADASGVNYPYTVQQVIDIYRDAVGADSGPETVSSALAKLSAANEAGCPLS